MIVPLVALLLQTTSPPVHVWLDAPSPLVRGAAVRVYVQVVTDGNLVVLQRRTDGRIGVLFPSSPAGAPFVRAGTYEIRGPSDRPAFVVAEPDGQGMILAALATDPVRFNEFVREADWNPDALVPSWGGGGADGEGALTDIVQRMLGDGTFNYDLVTYTVAPAVYAEQESAPGYAPYPTCVACTFIGTEVVVAAPFVGCDDFFGVCFGLPRFERRRERRQLAAERPLRVLALNLRPTVGPVALAPRRELPILKRDHSNAPIAPRKRLPDARPGVPARLPARGEPAVLERPLAPHAGGAIVVRRLVAPSSPLPAASSSLTAPLRHVQYTRLSNPNAAEDVRPGEGGRGAMSRGALVPAAALTGPPASRPRSASWEALGTARANVAAAPSDAAPGTVSRARLAPGTGATMPGTRSLALPSARSHATGGRAGVARGGVARH